MEDLYIPVPKSLRENLDLERRCRDQGLGKRAAVVDGKPMLVISGFMSSSQRNTWASKAKEEIDRKEAKVGARKGGRPKKGEAAKAAA